MKAMVIDGFGGADGLRMADVTTPQTGIGEVLIRIRYAGVNPVDWKIREGMLEGSFPHVFPIILGWDAAGTVAAVGEEVSEFALGRPVYAYCRKPVVQWGAYAESIVLSAAHVAPMPANLSFAEAASVPLVALTSWQSLFDAGRLETGQSVLIHAGAGGTGGMAIQFAKQAGAIVFTTASAANHDYVRDLGADHVIDYRSEDFVEAVKRIARGGVDLAYVNASGVLRKSYRAVRRGGRLVSIVEQPDPADNETHGVEGRFVFVEPNGGQLRQIAALIEKGVVRPLPIEEMPLADAAQALTKSQTGHVRGKIVLRIAAR